MWSMSTVVQVDSDRVIVTQLERRKNRSASPRFIFHSHPRLVKYKAKKENNTKLNSDVSRVPRLFSFRSWVSSVPAGIPFFFSSAMSSWRHLEWSESVPFWAIISALPQNAFILLLIPPCLMRASLLFVFLFFSSQGTALCTVLHFLHCTVLFPSTCSVGVSARLLRSSLLRSPASNTHGLFPLSLTLYSQRSCDVFTEGGAASPSSDTEIWPTENTG